MTTQSIEERLSAVESQASRAEGHALATANGLATVEQGQGRIERELKAVRREVAVGFTNLRDQLKRIHEKKERAEAALSFSHEDFEETATGSWKVTKDTVTRVLAQREQQQDAQRWRALWRRARWFVWIVVGGGGALAGDRLLQLLLKHF